MNEPVWSKQYLQRQVASAVSTFLDELESARSIVRSAANISREPSSLQVSRSALSGTEQKQVERRAAEYTSEFNERFEQYLSSRFEEIPEDRRNSSEDFYELSREEYQVILSSMSEQISEEVAKKYFSEFFERPLQHDYVLALLRNPVGVGLSNRAGKAMIQTLFTDLRRMLLSFVRIALLSGSEIFGDLPPIPQHVLSKYRASDLGLDSIQRWAADQKMVDIIGKDPSYWVTTLSAYLDFDVLDLCVDWDVVLEAAERTRLADESGDTVDSLYLERVPERLRATVTINDTLSVDSSYINSLSCELQVFAFNLLHTWYRRVLKVERDRYDPEFLEIMIELERSGRWTHALAMLDKVLELEIGDERRTGLVRLNRWFCLQKIRGNDSSITKEILEFKPETNYLGIGRAALLGDYDDMYTRLTREFETSLKQTSHQKRWFSQLPLIAEAATHSPKIKSLLAESPNRRRSRPINRRGRR